MRIEEVSIEDVFPFEDEYGNQFLSRDYSTKENQLYVQELARSMAGKGIPDEPVQLVADGGIYRIKSGNSRVMAMRELGTKRFPAIVYDVEDLSESIATTVRTDVKKKYEPVEMSRFVQQLAMFASDEYVAEAAGIEAEKVRRIRKARAAVDDAADDMTLDRLLAIEEFADSPEDVEALSTCRESEWQNVADGIRRRREVEADCAALREACEAAGAALADDAPNRDSGLLYSGSCKDPESVAGMWAGHPEGSVAWVCPDGYFGSEVRFYTPAADLGNDQEEAACAERIHEIKSMVEAGEDARAKWLAGHLPTLGGAQHTAARLGELFFQRGGEGWGTRPGDTVDQFAERTGAPVGDPSFWAPSGACAAYIYEKERPKLPFDFDQDVAHGRPASEWMRERVGWWLEWMEVLVSDGYVPCDADSALLDIARDLVSTREHDDGEAVEE